MSYYSVSYRTGTSRGVARIYHQAAKGNGKVYLYNTNAIKAQNSAYLYRMPITFQACLRVRMLALHSNRSYCYASRSRAAPTDTNPAPVPAILVRNAG